VASCPVELSGRVLTVLYSGTDCRGVLVPVDQNNYKVVQVIIILVVVVDYSKFVLLPDICIVYCR